MTFLSWATALLAASIAIPALLLLHFLKLRRQDKVISSTLLWKKAVQDLQVNAPFQRLRKNLLLLLQLLILAAVLFGMSEPITNFLKRPDKNIILLVDRSASMKVTEEDGRSRFEHVKQSAIDFVDSLADDSRAMVIGFADRASVVCSFTDDKRRLKRQIEDMDLTDGRSLIGEAVQLAEAYSTKRIVGDDEMPPEDVQTADIRIFSDCRIADAADVTVSRGEVRCHLIGDEADNVGIVSFDVRRDLERPGMLSVFAHIRNFGPEEIDANLSLVLDGRLLSAQDVILGPAVSATSRPAAETPSERDVVFQLYHDAGGVLEVKLDRKDALMADNVARTPIDPPRSVRVLIVTNRAEIRFLMERMFTKAFELEDVTLMSSSQYESADEANLAVDGRSAFDLVILDKHDTNRLWPGNYVFFGAAPKIAGCSLGDLVDDQIIVSWNESHPLLRHVSLENIIAIKWRELSLPDNADKIAYGESSPAIAFITDPGHRYVVTAFDLLDSTFHMHYAFVVFMHNAMDYLAAGGLTDTGRLVSPGETISVAVPPGATEVRFKRPDGLNDDLPVGDRLAVTYGKTSECGVYRAVFDDELKTEEVYAANILDAVESMIAPNEEFAIGGTQVEAVSGEIKVNEPLWPWAVVAALVLLLIEWWVYNRRVMI